MNKEIEQQIHNFTNAAYQFGKDVKAQFQKAYNDGYTAVNNINLIDEAYQEGLNDAWECAKKLALTSSDGGFDNKIVKEIFGSTSSYSIINNMSISTVVAKIKDYEEQQKQADAEIRVGDEVYSHLDESYKYIVTRIYRYDEVVANLLSQDGTWGVMELSNLHKTGKHYSQIAEVLKELRGDEE